MGNRNKYGQFCPVAQASEIVAERWMPLILRELICGSRRFNEIRRGVPLISPSLLSSRLRDLERAGVVKRVPVTRNQAEYRLTKAGKELRPIIEQLGLWGQRYAKRELTEEDVDVSLLMWDIRRRIRTDIFGKRRQVIRFDLTDAPQGKAHWWLLVDRGEVDLCLKHPGFDENLVITTDTVILTRVWRGDMALRKTLRTKKIAIQGDRFLISRFDEWFALSPFVEMERRLASRSR
jgi:DNA-binding HxlR family transcriptional regulator